LQYQNGAPIELVPASQRINGTTSGVGNNDERLFIMPAKSVGVTILYNAQQTRQQFVKLQMQKQGLNARDYINSTLVFTLRPPNTLKRNTIFSITTPFSLDYEGANGFIVGSGNNLICEKHTSWDLVAGIIVGTTVPCWVPLVVGEIALVALIIFIILQLAQKFATQLGHIMFFGRGQLCCFTIGGSEDKVMLEKKRQERIAFLIQSMELEVQQRRWHILFGTNYYYINNGTTTSIASSGNTLNATPTTPLSAASTNANMALMFMTVNANNTPPQSPLISPTSSMMHRCMFNTVIMKKQQLQQHQHDSTIVQVEELDEQQQELVYTTTRVSFNFTDIVIVTSSKVPMSTRSKSLAMVPKGSDEL